MSTQTGDLILDMADPQWEEQVEDTLHLLAVGDNLQVETPTVETTQVFQTEMLCKGSRHCVVSKQWQVDRATILQSGFLCHRSCSNEDGQCETICPCSMH
ncbi:hypothetical protein F7725_023576 [Dissostichus mawsoni]|uniref:Uncharacterized protein n=1 Tax=Dissostichus mawsoni TaxID=36200 RepID=A0A7J5XWY2_DISMA|nr:hypothetical protein F7725_023576 [Dissostichus mawsoni]